MCCCSGRRRLQTCQEWTQRPALKSGSEESPGVRNYSEDPETEPLPMRGKPQQQKARLTRPQASAFSQIFPGRSLRLLSGPSQSPSTEASQKKTRAPRAVARSPSAQAQRAPASPIHAWVSTPTGAQFFHPPPFTYELNLSAALLNLHGSSE